MKKLLLVTGFAAVAAAAVFTSCNKLKDLAKVNLNLENDDAQFTIPVVPAATELTIVTNDVYVNLDSMIKAQNKDVSANNVKEVRVSSCELRLLDGNATSNFSALESCKIEIKSNTKPDYITFANVNNPDEEKQTLLLTPANIDLKDYFLNANVFSYRVSGKTRRGTDKELQCLLVVKYTIVAGL